jgi:hypothetical protein
MLDDSLAVICLQKTIASDSHEEQQPNYSFRICRDNPHGCNGLDEYEKLLIRDGPCGYVEMSKCRNPKNQNPRAVHIYANSSNDMP